VATYAKSGGIFNNLFSADLPENLPVKKMVNRLGFDRVTDISLWPHFFGPFCMYLRRNDELSEIG